jgi:putative methionine-R-sulfoxide reductase with GAF domain
MIPSAGAPTAARDRASMPTSNHSASSCCRFDSSAARRSSRKRYGSSTAELRRAEVLNLWVAVWSAAAAPEQAVLAGRVVWVSALVLVPNLIGLVRELAGRPCSRRLLVGLGAADLALLTLVWFTPAVIADWAYLRRDALGSEYWSPVPWPLMPALVSCILLVFAYGLVTLWRARSLDQRERRALLIGFAAYAAMGIHDILHATRLIQSVQIFHWGFVAVALGLNGLLVRRFTRLSQNLESEVATRTRELESRGDQLGALGRSGHSLMGGLPLQTVLARIMTEASRIASTPHIMVFLVDRGTSMLRLAASAGRSVTAGWEVALGPSFSGWVAATGRSLFIPDTRNDPRNLLVRQGREAGILTYLGLPIMLKEQVLGVLVFNTEAPREYTPEEISYLSAFADQDPLAPLLTVPDGVANIGRPLRRA